MRVIAAIAGIGICLGVVVGLILSEVRGSKDTASPAVCTVESIGLAPTIGLDRDGRRATLGFQTPGTLGCLAPSASPRGVGVRVESADGKLLVERREKGGPPPTTLVQTRLIYSVTVPARQLCEAKQPLRFTVWVIGLTAAGVQRLHLVGGTCAL